MKKSKLTSLTDKEKRVIAQLERMGYKYDPATRTYDPTPAFNRLQDLDLRLKALDYAMIFYQFSPQTSEGVVSVAQRFLNFLKGVE